jgi:hypothetical protein
MSEYFYASDFCVETFLAERDTAFVTKKLSSRSTAGDTPALKFRPKSPLVR